MSKKSKSKRFVQQGRDSVKKHDERFPYKQTFADVERTGEEDDHNSIGGLS
ncbi:MULTISPECIES: hypothetical protein [Pontibacillus]|uniref:Competence protein n=1 Tax=Pontibacillus chungwhensis TaxID=265426 RepID=A0ABY8V578_9BACI|nr:hypothetical protein [Pontibacillus chungwhensis]MCD5324711.1 hypothetical protein [Pontibacillus sp. HN14]WIF98996.1 hypothetical protein QNI29_04900 [Pontibacillus chungwhensis]